MLRKRSVLFATVVALGATTVSGQDLVRALVCPHALSFSLPSFYDLNTWLLTVPDCVLIHSSIPPFLHSSARNQLREYGA